MSITFKKRGDYTHLNKHNLLNGLDLSDQHPMSSIINLVPIVNQFGECIENMNKKINTGDIGSGYGIVSRPRFKKDIIYQNNKIIREEYSGDINKVVEYIYNGDTLVNKIVKRNGNKTFDAKYDYDEDGRLISVIDNGTDEEFIHRAGGIASYYSISDNIRTQSEVLVCDVKSAFIEYNMATILGIEIIIKNVGIGHGQIKVVRDNDIIMSTQIESFNVQKYNLGISKNIKVFVFGDIDYEFNISYIQNEDTSNGGINPHLYHFLINMSNKISDMELRYDTILQSVSNNEESFTDLLIDESNIEDSVNYKV